MVDIAVALVVLAALVGREAGIIHVATGQLIVVSHHAVGHTPGSVELRRNVKLPFLERRNITHGDQSLELVLQCFLAQLVLSGHA